MPQWSAGFSGYSNYRLDVAVSLVSQDVNANVSAVAWSILIVRTGGSGTFRAAEDSAFSMEVNGVVGNGYFDYDFRTQSTLVLAEGTTYVAHDADGTKNIAIRGAVDTPAALGDADTGYNWIALPTIPRASTGTFSPSATINAGETVTINTNRASATFTHDVTFQFGSASGSIGTDIEASTTWTPPLTLLEQIPNATSGVGTITVTTKSGANVIGSKNSSFTLAAPSSVAPSVTSITALDTNTDVATHVEKYVQGLSAVQVTVEGSGVRGSTITSAQATLGTTTVASGGTIPVTHSGDATVTGRVVDSRGRSSTSTATLNALPYSSPIVTAYQARRSDAAGTLVDDGAHIRIDVSAVVASLLNGTERNALTIRAFTRPRGTTAWTTRNVLTPGSLTYDGSFVIDGGAIFSPTASWDVRVQIHDRFGVYIADTLVATATVTLDLNGANVGIGKVHEQGALDVAGVIYQEGNVVLDTADLATAAEARAGASTTKLVTPATMRAARLTGTSAERDAYFGVPATDAARVALANQRIIWSNTDHGWDETYFAITGTAGLTVRGLLANAAAGWYPVTGGPSARLHTAGAQAHVSGSYFTNWLDFGSANSFGESWRSHTFIDRPGPSDLATLRARMPGRYDLEVQMEFPSGTGTGVWRFGYLDGVGPVRNTDTPVVLQSGYGQIDRLEFKNVVLYDTARCFMQTVSLSWSVGLQSAWMSMRYVGPALTTA